MLWIIVYVSLAILLISIILFIYAKWMQAYFVIEISRCRTMMTVHKSWFFQNDLVLSVEAKKIKVCNCKTIKARGVVKITRPDKKVFDRHFKIVDSDSIVDNLFINKFINISYFADCRFIPPL